MESADSKKRIVLLDAFRCLAILYVMLFHYTFRWTPPYDHINFYPYKQWYGNLFSNGNFGVSFFFCISGFVISFTLEKTESIKAFIKNRFIRLFPPLLLCTIITFVTIHFLDPENLLPAYHLARNFLPSLTLINPVLYKRAFNTDFWWLDGSYWSLWVEIQFYMLSSILYFSNKKKYFTNILIAALLISLVRTVLVTFTTGNSHLPVHLPAKVREEIVFWIVNGFNLTLHIPFFAAGVVFHKLYKDHTITDKTSKFLVALTLLVTFINARSLMVFILIIAMHILFLLMIYKPRALNFLNNSFLIRLGVLSYTMYLIHEPIGIFSIKHFGPYLGSLSFLAPWIMITLVILFAELSYRTYEKKTHRFLKRILFKSSVQTHE